MNKLYFITGNENKRKEISELLPDYDIEKIEIDLPEIQELDPHLIIQEKLDLAKRSHDKAFIVEDTSLMFEPLNGLPGPLIKWFIQGIGIEGLANFYKDFDCTRATAKTLIGFSEPGKEIQFFEGEVTGEIVSPRGETKFGWDPIFIPQGQTQTFAEMSPEQKNKFSMRKQAVEKLKKYLDRKSVV